MIQREQAIDGAVAIGFDHEHDLAVFMPGSADVFLCSKLSWRALGRELSGEQVSSSEVLTSMAENHTDVSNLQLLKAALTKSGASFS